MGCVGKLRTGRKRRCGNRARIAADQCDECATTSAIITTASDCAQWRAGYEVVSQVCCTRAVSEHPGACAAFNITGVCGKNVCAKVAGVAGVKAVSILARRSRKCGKSNRRMRTLDSYFTDIIVSFVPCLVRCARKSGTRRQIATTVFETQTLMYIRTRPTFCRVLTLFSAMAQMAMVLAKQSIAT